jgi:hypothetical protein
MLLKPPSNKRGFKKEGLLRVLLNHPDGSLSKREVGREAGTTGAWAVKFTNQLEEKGLIDGTAVKDPRGLYDYWRKVRVSPSRVTVSVQSPVETIQNASWDYAFTTYQAENAHQGFLFASNTAVYVHPDDASAWSSFIEDNGLIGGGNTEFRIADDHVFYQAETVNGIRTVSVPQLIVDLLDEGGPCVEAAERLIESFHERS